jgi:uncharacterized repeat protein (TIGR01451 family)
MIDAQTSDGDSISLGTQSIQINKVQNFFADVDISVAKSDPGTGARIGEQFDYTVVVSNTSSDDLAQSVVLTDTLDPNTGYVSGSLAVSDVEGAPTLCTMPTGAWGGEFTCDLGFLNPNEVVTLTFTVLVSDSAPFVGTNEDGPTCVGADLCNQVEVRPLTDTTTDNNSDEEPTDVIPMRIMVDKVADPTSLPEPAGGRRVRRLGR